MESARLDQKMRVRLPKRVREKLKVRPKETIVMEIKEDGVLIKKQKQFDFSNDPVLRDMIERPMHTKIKVTTELLNKWKDEMWMG